jgi:hypothetical protein
MKNAWSKLLVLPLLLPLASGCIAVAAAGAGAAGVFYVKGALKAELDGTPPQVGRACVAALKDLKLPVESSETTELDGKIESHTATGEKITITLESKGEKTEVAIRVGTFGDEDVSRRILDEIEGEL